ncbi:MAG TPA: DUF5050 domain-containing protein [Candidatus Cryosericum sp.]|nr:DUF5050 domain-containing protein [Candidatus Cryosericum sp.]
MKKRLVTALLLTVAIVLLCACGKANPVVPAESAATAVPAAEAFSPADEIAAAKTPEELRALLAAYQADGDNDSVYMAAIKLIELAPNDTQAYQDAIAALLGSISGDYEEIQRLVTLALTNAPDGAKDFSAWANAQNQAFSYTVPFIGDYASEAEINAVGITPGNLTNQDALSASFLRNGLLTTQGNWVYFMLPNADYYVFKMRLDGTGFTNVGDARGDNLNVVGDWLYYKNLNDQDMVYRIRTDGTQKEKLQFNKAVMMAVTKDAIFYTDNALYCAKLDGSEPIKLMDGAFACMSLYDGWVYYCTGGNNSEFCRIPAEGGEPQKLLDGWIPGYAIQDGWIYYLSNNGQNAVSRIRTDGSDPAEVYRSDSAINSFNVSADKLVVSACAENDDRGKPYPTDLVVIDLASSSVLHTLKQYTSNFYISGDFAFFLDEQFAWQAFNLTTGTVQAVEIPTSIARTTASGESGNTSANLFMGLDSLGAGLVARADTTLYFANPKDGGRFSKVESKDDGGFSKFLDTYASAINVTSDAIYFCDTSDQNSIYTVAPSGENLRKIVNGPCYDLSCLGKWLFYRTTDGIYQVSANEGEPVLLQNGQFRCAYASNGFVYYLEDNDGGGLWRTPLDESGAQPLLTNHRALFYSIQGEALYCMIDAGNSVDIVRMKLDGSEQETIYSTKEKLDAISVTDTYLLILKSAADGVHSMILVQSLDGTNTIKTIEDLVDSAAWIFGSDVYYITEQGLTRQNLDSGDMMLVVQ